MELEEYYSFLEILAQQEVKIGENICNNLDELLMQKDVTATNALAFRSALLGDTEKNVGSAYLSIGLFLQYDEQTRLACFCIGLEADYIRSIKCLEKKCSRYDKKQPIFSKVPALYSHVRDEELIDYSVLQRVGNSEIVCFNGTFSYIDGHVPLNLINWMDKSHPEKPLFVRIDPDAVFEIRPPQKILESVLIPPNPKWWEKLKIYNRQHEGCSFYLDKNVLPKDHHEEYWDYHCKNIRRLDVVAKRDGNGNLSMMLEELEEQVNIISPAEKYIIGRMIHLDTNAPLNTSFGTSILNHLDLAINIYTGENATRRMVDNLANGTKITDASFRTHILRVEQIPFADIFEFAYSFFRSKLLIDEWKSTQFSDKE